MLSAGNSDFNDLYQSRILNNWDGDIRFYVYCWNSDFNHFKLEKLAIKP